MIYFSSTSVTRTSPFQCICFIVVLSNQDNSNKKISLINKSGHQRNLLFYNMFGGPSWLWSYGSWSYNYLCHQCLSPQTCWVQILLMARCTRYTHYVIKFVS